MMAIPPRDARPLGGLEPSGIAALRAMMAAGGDAGASRQIAGRWEAGLNGSSRREIDPRPATTARGDGAGGWRSPGGYV